MSTFTFLIIKKCFTMSVSFILFYQVLKCALKLISNVRIPGRTMYKNVTEWKHRVMGKIGVSFVFKMEKLLKEMKK